MDEAYQPLPIVKEILAKYRYETLHADRVLTCKMPPAARW
jgi:hypothetical protein